jgi:hypothetical protein
MVGLKQRGLDLRVRYEMCWCELKSAAWGDVDIVVLGVV